MATAESAQTGLWSAPTTWVGGVVPGVGGKGYKVLIKAGHVVTLDQDVFIGDDRATNALEIESGATLDTLAGHPEYWLWTMGLVHIDGLLDATVLINIADYILAISFPPNATLRIELRNRDDVLIHVFYQILDMSWSYLRLGGCDEARAIVRLPFTEIDPLSILDYDFRIVIDDEAASKATWWRGSVTDAGRVMGDADALEIDALGLGRYLDVVAVVGLGFDMQDGATFFENMDATDIATALLDRVAAWSGITYDGTSAPASGVVLDHIEFNGSILNAIADLAKIANDIEWAIDRNGIFHFRAKSVDATWLLMPGKDVASGFNDAASLRSLVNRLYIIGQDNFMVEDNADLVVDQSQVTETAVVDFGRITGAALAMQTFSTTMGTVSEIDIKLRKTNFVVANLLTNGDMESGVTGWTALTGRSVRASDTLAYAGAAGLKVRHNQTGKGVYGVYQNYTSATPGLLYKFTGKIKQPAWEGPVTVQLVDGSATPYPGNNAILAEFTEVRGMGGFWQHYALAAEAVGTTIGVRVFADNRLGGTGNDPFWIDEFWLTAGWDVELALVDPSHPSGAESDEAVIAATEVPFDSIADTLGGWSTHTMRLSAYLSPGVEYGIRFKSLGPLSDSQYFSLSVGTGYGGGTLKIYDGMWVDQAPEDAYFVTRLPASIANYRLRSMVVSNPAIFGATEAQLFGNSMLANLGAPQRRASVPLTGNWRAMIEFTGPPMGTVQVYGMMPEPLRPERISYRYDEMGIHVSPAELGMILPTDADLLRRIEYQLSRLDKP